MARLPPFKRFSIESFKEVSEWIGKLLSPLNSFMETVSTALNNGITVEDNMRAEFKTISVRQEASGTYPILFTPKFADRPRSLIVSLVAENSDNPSTLTTAVFADWAYTSSGQIAINNLTGLTNGKVYSVTLLVLY